MGLLAWFEPNWGLLTGEYLWRAPRVLGTPFGLALCGGVTPVCGSRGLLGVIGNISLSLQEAGFGQFWRGF